MQTADEPLHTVRLVGVPVRVLAAGRQHHDELMREFALLALSEDEHRHDVPKRLTELIDTLGRRYATVVQRPDAELDAALAAGDDTVDLTYQVPGHIVDDAARLEQLLSDADEFCCTEQMLTLARGEVDRDFTHWYLDEFRRQIAGQPPLAWAGPLHP